MTNNWVDLAYSTMFFVCGANPVENHPASIAHLNSARFDTNGRGRNAALVVVDPRQTRTARMIKAGYDSTNPNDMRKHDRYVRIRPGTNIAWINGLLNSIITWMYANPTAPASINFFAWHNGTAANSMAASRAVITDNGSSSTYGPWPKYCDSRVKVDVATGDYQRTTVTAANGIAVSNYPLLAADVSDADCVFQRLRAHVAKYDAATVAQICGCTEADIAAVRDAYIANSRFASSDFGAAAQTQNAAGYRATCIMYAMGATQFTTGSQGVRTYAVIQTLMGNMGRCGGGINALRGIHNVQGSTDMGVLFDLIPAYSGNPGVGQTYADYSNKLFGNRVLGTGALDPYNRANLGLQQRGFYNMSREFFGNRNVTDAADFERLWSLWPKGNGVQHIEAFRRMSENWVPAADKPRIRGCVVWGQNPAVAEPNQQAVRKGLHDLDLLVVADLFATETAQTSRKATGVTYLLPAASHVEEAGSVASSGR
jgi:formate dehydrogenase major subunit